MRRFTFPTVVATVLCACGSGEPQVPSKQTSTAAGSTFPSNSTSASVPSSPLVTPSATADAEKPAAPAPPHISYSEAKNITFPSQLTAAAEGCKPASAEKAAEEEAIRCLIRARFNGDDAARDLALNLYNQLGTVTGVITEHTMDGGWRGQLHLVPEPPMGKYKKHLQWILSSFVSLDSFFKDLDKQRPSGTSAQYRYRALGFRFFRSVGRTTPSAYADGWEVSYNVSGSLHSSAEAVRETLFHEIFHSNDADHNRWSSRTLVPIVDGILSKCGQKTPCLAPYAPGTTMVRGGTYYAFQAGNGVWEYAAELATRYLTEHTTLLKGEKLKKPPFKCGPPENGKTWKLLVDEFFGVDLTPACTP
ncbi:MAG: hypothetical protein IPK82_04170 [Polyangiaceae bacterium]|nr:hypothetical protein [Polyangiaceae bacterium]